VPIEARYSKGVLVFSSNSVRPSSRRLIVLSSLLAVFCLIALKAAVIAVIRVFAYIRAV
jgi:hypothetical protein